MITEEDIDNASMDESGRWAPSPVHIHDIYRRDDFEAGFRTGVDWFINAINHNPKEAPIIGELIIVWMKNGIITSWIADENSLESFECFKVVRWYYSKDLLIDKEE